MQDIVWVNNFTANGYGICGRRYVEILHSLGYKVKPSPTMSLAENDPLNDLLNVKVENPLTIYHHIPSYFKKAYYTVTEVRRPPVNQSTILDKTELILTQSRFCKERFSEITDASKIKIIHFPFKKEDFSPVGPAFPLKIPKRYTFKFFCMARYDVRKNIPMLVKAFKEEFKKNRNVALIVKINSDRYCVPVEFKYAWGSPKNVFWMPEFVQITSPLYRAMDAFCIADCGEGWGAPTTEAMLCGLPTIAPRHSGHLDYMNDDNSYLIDVGNWEKIGYRDDNLYPELLHAEMEWKMPVFKDIKAKLRECYEEFKDFEKVTKPEHPMIKKALEVIKIVNPIFVGKQLKKAFKWAEYNIKVK